MKKTSLVLVVLALSMNMVWAETTKEFPADWGKPPAIQTRDYVELPGGYGHGSSTLAKWIAANLAKDKVAAEPPTPAKAELLYENNFEKAEVGKLPEELKFPNGDFTVREDGGNKFLELPGVPLDSFSVGFGPTETADLTVSARIYGTTKGRRAPTFGVGLNGVGGYRLQVSPGKKAVELYKDQEVRASVPFDWKPGQWMMLRLQVRKLKEGEWKIEGRVWPHGTTEPDKWLIAFDEKEEPVSGCASVFGSPFSGTPIWFDDLVVTKAGGR